MDQYISRDLIAKVKDEVKVIYYADLLCGACDLASLESPEGIRWIGHCPLRLHDVRMRTFTVGPEANTWYCSGCRHGGDIIALAKAYLRVNDEYAVAQFLVSIPFLRGA